MAKLTVKLDCKVAWWVRPYLWAAAGAWRLTVPLVPMTAADEEAYAHRCTSFAIAHGVRFFVNGRPA